MNISNTEYEELKTYYDTKLNTDKSTYKSTNDEPTPIQCVEEMLNVLPESIWRKPCLKILDPCCGNGNFHLVAFQKLKKYKSTKEIVEDVLYFNDINEDRLENVKNIYYGDQYNLNISNCDFLTKAYDTSFDIIVANPPYAKFLENGKRASKNHNLIKAFLEKGLSLLKPNGYLVFITPDNWMSLADRNSIITNITKLQIHHLNIHTAKKYFKKIGSSFTWYVVENSKYYKDIYVEGIFKNHEFKSNVPSCMRNYIPLFYTDKVYSILSKTIDNENLAKYKVETTSDLHKYTKRNFIKETQDEEHPYRLIHTPKQTVWSSKPHKYQEGYKVFISTTDKYNVFVDDCGMTQSIAFIRCYSLEEAEKVKNILQHPLYIFLNNICRWGNFNNVRILQRFPIPNDGSDVFSSFDITEEEQSIIIDHV